MARPEAPGSLVCSITATARHVEGRAARRCAAENGRNSRTCRTPTLSPFSPQDLRCGASRLRARAHQDDDPFGVFRSLVIEEMILPAGQFGEGIHGRLHDARHFGIEGVHRLTRLKKGVRVMRGAADERVLGVERASTMSAHQVVVDHGPQSRRRLTE